MDGPLERGAEIDKPDGGGCTPLHGAARYGRADVVRLLLERGADIDRRTNSGKTPLRCAIERQHKEPSTNDVRTEGGPKMPQFCGQTI